MPTQASSPSSSRASGASVYGSGSAFYSASAASSHHQQKQKQQRPSNNQDEHNNTQNATSSRISKHEQSFEKQKELVAAATAKAFANRSGGNSSQFLSSTQFANMRVDGINPYVEQQHSGDEEEDEYEEYEEYDDDEDDDGDGSNQSMDEWENPSYLVKNLDTGESYNVEEIDQHYNLITLDAVAAQHESTCVYEAI